MNTSTGINDRLTTYYWIKKGMPDWNLQFKRLTEIWLNYISTNCPDPTQTFRSPVKEKKLSPRPTCFLILNFKSSNFYKQFKSKLIYSLVTHVLKQDVLHTFKVLFWETECPCTCPFYLGSQGSSSHTTSFTLKEGSSQVLHFASVLSSLYNSSDCISLHASAKKETVIHLIYTPFSYCR